MKDKLDMLDEDVRAPQLDAVYEEICDMNMRNPHDRRYASKALKWMMCSQRSLKIAELVEAVSIDTEGNIDTEVNEAYIRETCSNLLVTDNDGDVQFAHLSVREYLINRQAYSEAAAHAQAAKTCLAYVLHTDISRATSSEGGGIGWYAICHWPFHCSESKEIRQQDASLRKLFDELMSTSQVHVAFVQWINSRYWQRQFTGVYNIERAESSVSIPPSPWFTACVWGFSEVLQTSLHTAAESDLERRNIRGETGLYLASRYGHFDVVNILIKNNVNTDLTNYGFTALHTAVCYNRIDVTRLLLANGASCTKVVEFFYDDKYDLDRFTIPIGSLSRPGDNASHLAARCGCEEIMISLLQKGVDINARNHKEGTVLHIAVQQNYVKQARLLLQMGISINTPNFEGDTALHIAARQNHIEQVRLLLEMGIAINTSNFKGDTALHIAARQNHVEQVQLFIEYGACIGLKEGQGKTAISQAAREGSVETVQLLTDELPDKEDARWWVNATRFMRAIDLSDEVLVQQLLDDDGLQGRNGGHSLISEKTLQMKAIHSAAFRGNEEIVTMLLDKGADIDIRDSEGRTPLLTAIINQRSAVVKLLLDHGANTEVEDHSRERALDYTACRREAIELVRLLLEGGADIEAKDPFGRRALHGAASFGGSEMTQFLLERGATINAEDCDGRIALHDGANRPFNRRTVQILLEKGADIEAKDNMRQTALHYAAKTLNNDETVKLLLENGADIEARDRKGWSALHLASTENRLSSVQLLLEKGADIHAEDIDGKTALDLAVYHVSVEVIPSLLEGSAIPRRFYDEIRQYRSEKFEGWMTIQEMLKAWGEANSNYR